MHDDLISRSALLEAFNKDGDRLGGCESWHISAIETEIECAPAVDAVEVVNGRWCLLDECSNEGVYCSVCHKKVYRTDYANQKVKSNYCPNCGAIMDGGKDDGT